MKVLNTNGWMYLVELEEPAPGRPGRYFFGNKVRGIVTSDPESAMENMRVPEVLKGQTVAIPSEIETSMKRALADENDARSGRVAGEEQHEHISERHSERHPHWPRIAKKVREALARKRKEDTASIDEIYGRYL